MGLRLQVKPPIDRWAPSGTKRSTASASPITLSEEIFIVPRRVGVNGYSLIAEAERSGNAQAPGAGAWGPGPFDSRVVAVSYFVFRASDFRPGRPWRTPPF